MRRLEILAGIGLAALALAGCAVTQKGDPMEIGRIFADDMTMPNALKPHGIEGADWAAGPRVGQGDTWPQGWICGIMWGQIYYASEGSPATNVRVQIRDTSYWILGKKDGKWRRVQHSTAPEGAAYREDFVNDENAPADVRKEADESVSVRLVPGYNYHFWPSSPGRVTVDTADVAGQASAFFARLVVDDPAKPDDLAQARLIGSCGGDHWRDQGAQWKADWSNNGDWAIGRFKLITPEWQVFTATTLSLEAILRNPPPLELPAK